jgi:translocation and assembly module TamA
VRHLARNSRARPVRYTTLGLGVNEVVYAPSLRRNRVMTASDGNAVARLTERWTFPSVTASFGDMHCPPTEARVRPATGILLAVLLALGACKSQRPPRAPTGDAAESILDIRVVGATAFDGDTLRAGLDTRDAVRNRDPFSPRQVSLDEQRLRAFYYKHGYFDVDVSSSFEQTKAGVIVTFRVREGNRAVVESVDLDGLPEDREVVADEIRGQLLLAKGDRFDYETYELDEKKVLDLMQHAGYAHADVTGTVLASGNRNSTQILYSVTPGPPVTFGTITVTGTKGELHDAVVDRVKMKEGERFDPQAIVDTQTALYDLGRFSSVRIELPDEGAPPVLPVKITLIESPRNEWRLGGGAGVDTAEYQLRARAAYSILGWPTPLMNTRLDLRPKYSWLRDATQETQLGADASVTFERLDMFYPHIRGEARIAYELQAYELYTGDAGLFRLGADSPLGKRVHVGAGWQIRGMRFREVHPAVEADADLKKELGFGDFYRLAYFDQSISLDLRDDPVQPELGAYGELRIEEGTPWAGSEFSYVKLTPEIRGYLGKREWAVLAARLRVGTFYGDVPVTQRYFSGGASSQRGFPERRLAPTLTATVGEGEDAKTESVVLGGGALAETGVELRIPLHIWSLGAALFADGADVTEEIADIDPLNLHWAVGGGLRLGTPVGPARIDYGYRITRQGDLRDENWAIHLSLGHTY